MNGRMYDPFQGRFLSPDPYVQDPLNPLNYNRYAYCLNNPTKYTDPTGHNPFLIAAAVIAFMYIALPQEMTGTSSHQRCTQAMLFIVSSVAGGVAGSAVSLTSGGFVGGFASGFASGAAGGFVNGAGTAFINGGDFGDAITMGIKQSIIGGLAGGVLGGTIRGAEAVWGDKNRVRNFWNGDDVAMGRKPFSLNNTDRPFTHYRSTLRYEPRSFYERIITGSRNLSYDDYIRYRDAVGISNGAISRCYNYTLPGDGVVSYSLDSYVGRADLNIISEAQLNYTIMVNGNAVTPTNGYIPLWEGSNTVSVQVSVNNSFGSFNAIAPFKFTITGFK